MEKDQFVGILHHDVMKIVNFVIELLLIMKLV